MCQDEGDSPFHRLLHLIVPERNVPGSEGLKRMTYDILPGPDIVEHEIAEPVANQAYLVEPVRSEQVSPDITGSIPPVPSDPEHDESKTKSNNILLFAAMFLALAAFIIALIFSHFAPFDLLVITSSLAFVVIIIVMYFLWAAPDGDHEEDVPREPDEVPTADHEYGINVGIEIPEEVEGPEEIEEPEEIGEDKA